MIVGAERLSKLIKDNMQKNDNKKIKVAVLGHTGKLGKLVIDLFQDNNIDFCGGIGRDYIIPEDTQMIVDVSSEEGTKNLMKKLNTSRIPLLIGTTGNLPIKELKLYSRFAPVAVISNFSEGIPLVMEWVRLANEKLQSDWKYNITETHHINKLDKPSGTAKSINEQLSNKANIISIRKEDIYGNHNILFESDSELIEISHVAKKRNIFAEGCIKYVNWLSKMKPGFYTKLENQEVEKKIDSSIINFQKYSGCGNDFILIDSSKNKLPNNFVEFVQTICKRGSNIGADGVIIMTIDYEKYDAKWVYFNSDGSMAKMCGNGLRCAAKYVYDNTDKQNSLKLITGDGVISVSSLKDNGDVFVSIPLPESKDIDDDLRRLIENILDKDLITKTPDLNNIYRIDVSVPHIVIFLKSLDCLNNINVNQMGKIVNDLLDDIDVNVNFVFYSDNKFYIRTFERGVFSETLACGTGCCAFAYIINRFMNIEDINIQVRSGCTMKIFFKNDSIFLEGKAKMIYKGLVDLSNLNE